MINKATYEERRCIAAGIKGLDAKIKDGAALGVDGRKRRWK